MSEQGMVTLTLPLLLSALLLQGMLAITLHSSETASKPQILTAETQLGDRQVVDSRAATNSASLPGRRSFKIDYENNQFLKDGEPFRYIAGAIHYFRVHPDLWQDRLRKLRYAGFNAVQTYVEWSSHEPEPSTYRFSGAQNLTHYLALAEQEGLLVILRPGPYICAERDMGGLPYWLLRENPSMYLRSNDPSYLSYVDIWLGEILLPMIRPLLYSNGGPVIMVQVENEYGSYEACDYEYTAHLRELFRQKLGEDALLFTTDGNSVSYLKCGKIPQVYATVDFGPGVDVNESFIQQRLFEPQGPLINSEFYPGWLDHWGEPHNTRTTEEVSKTFEEILAANASVAVYVFHGGTDFGLSSGANLGSKYQACPTSYDYDAPITEAGDFTEKYFALRNITLQYLPPPPVPAPSNSRKYQYGEVKLSPFGNVFEVASRLHLPTVDKALPAVFEELSVQNGLVIYQTRVDKMTTDPTLLKFNSVHDRGYTFLDDTLVGVVSREEDIYSLPVFARPNQTLSVVVESQGRIGFGKEINDFKGIIGNVTLQGDVLINWRMIPLALGDLSFTEKLFANMRTFVMTEDSTSANVNMEAGLKPTVMPAAGRLTFYGGSFEVPDNVLHPQDTFLRLDGWTKGVVWVNDFCLGRYWPVAGPQVTLYVPHPLLKHGNNSLLVLELESSPCSLPGNCIVSLTDIPEIDGPTP